MTRFLNNIDGSKLAIFCSFLLALAAMIFIGIHLLRVDGTEGLAEIQFLEQVVQTVLAAGGLISSVHVVTGAIVNVKNSKNQPQTQGGGTGNA